MGSESKSTSTATSSPSAKRNRDPEDEVYVDNLRSHKRYLSEVHNGVQLKWINGWRSAPGESNGISGKDEMSMQYSPMSEDSDDARFCELPVNSCSSQSDSLPTSPVSPHRYQRPLSGFSSAPSPSSYPSHGCSVSGVASSQQRQRGSDSEGRFPSSPSDICHSGDLRRAALLRSGADEISPPGLSSFEVEERPCSYMKSLADEREYQIEECSSLRMSEPGYGQEKSCRVLNMNMKGGESHD